MAELECTIATPERLVFEGHVCFVVLPALDGELGVLPRHAPLVGALGCGELRVDLAVKGKRGEARARFFVRGGFLEVERNRVTVLAEQAVPAVELDLEAEETSLKELQGARPPSGTKWEEREVYDADLRAAKLRVALARKAS